MKYDKPKLFGLGVCFALVHIVSEFFRKRVFKASNRNPLFEGVKTLFRFAFRVLRLNIVSCVIIAGCVLYTRIFLNTTRRMSLSNDFMK